MPIAIGFSAMAGGFGVVWHIWWLAALGLLAVVSLVIKRTSSDHNEHVISAARVAKIEESLS